MPVQTGNMPVKGTMNNMSYYKSKDGTMVKMKTVIPKEKFKTKSFELTHRNNLEFGLAGKAAKTLRHAIRTIISICKDPRVSSRLTTLMLKIAKTDTTSPHGERNVTKGQLALLNGFDFNIDAPLSGNFSAPYTMNIERATGKILLDIPPFNPANLLTVPEGSTHFKLVSAGCEIDFVNDVYNTQTFETAEIPVTDPLTADFNIGHQVAANSTQPLFLILGIQFLQEVNGIKYPIRSSNANSMAILKVEPA